MNSKHKQKKTKTLFHLTFDQKKEKTKKKKNQCQHKVDQKVVSKGESLNTKLELRVTV